MMVRKSWVAVLLLLAASLSAGAQAVRDRNLVHKRVPMDVTTTSPSREQEGARSSRSEQVALQGIERQTDRTLAQASKKQTMPAVKFASDRESRSHEAERAMPLQPQPAHPSSGGRGVGRGTQATLRKH
jgi:hypothetical protein